MVGLGDLVDEIGTGWAGFNDGLVGEVKVVGGFVVVNDEDGLVVEAILDGGVVEEFREEDAGGGVNDNVAVGQEIKLIGDA